MKFKDAEDVMKVAIGVNNLSFFRSYVKLLEDALEVLETPECEYDLAHTQSLCGNANCRES